MLKLCVYTITGILAAPVQAATLYVATTGSDANPGTAGAPFRSWQRAVDIAKAGDTILIQPGTYRVSGATRYGVLIDSKSGTSTSRIRLKGNGGKPVLDCSNMTSSSMSWCFGMKHSNWWVIQDIVVTGARQNADNQDVRGLSAWNSGNNIFRQIETRNNQGPGLMIDGNSPKNLVEKCDSHHNFDPRSSPQGGQGDGFVISGLPSTATGNAIVKSRAWSNSDDGYDLWQSEASVDINTSWAFWNGISEGDGNGFKLGVNTRGPIHIINRNLAFQNRATGFTSNGGRGSPRIYNNTAYANGRENFEFVYPSDLRHFLKNNVSYRGGRANAFARSATQQANNWNLSFTVTDGDFLSVNPAGSDRPRPADASLPRLNFLRLAPGSKLRGRGVYVGIPYTGTAPSLGAYEP